jgi:hypothetical protein
MIRLPLVPLPARAQSQLSRWQQDIDAIANYASRVAAGKTRFASRNTSTNGTFREVRKALKQMCSGAKRCAYCEDSASNQVEHMRPKDLYPDQVFQWTNYTYACGLCNGPKNNRFGVLLPGQMAVTIVTRPPRAPVVPPPVGTFALLDPRVEDPFDFLHLDLLGTFYFLPRLGLGAAAHARADYTIELLTLNARDYLPQARAEAYASYRARLVEYLDRRNADRPERELDTLILALQRMQHPTVWREMQRQHTHIPALASLFAQAPEALAW